MKLDPTDGQLSFSGVHFTRFKAFKDFSVSLEHFNILVGPNNAGKSTIIAAFKILSVAIKKAQSRSAEFVNGPQGRQQGHIVELKDLSVAEENLFYNYDTEQPATVTFTFTNKKRLVLYFEEANSCVLLIDADGARVQRPNEFKRNFPCDIGFVPILGPVEHQETLNTKETARIALYNSRASRNFRNIWYHDPSDFVEFQQMVRDTWPGMDINEPEVTPAAPKPELSMFCPEDRIPREIAWAGYGFQVWCQILTQIVKSKKKSLFIIDEPDIYLHSDLQRQLLHILRGLGADVIIATHSTEIISEADLGEIVLIDKKRSKSKRITNTQNLKDAFKSVGTNLNVVMTQISKTGKVIFVEGDDMLLLSRLAKIAGYPSVASRRGFQAVSLGGHRPHDAQQRLAGMEEVHGETIQCGLILDRDYRCRQEVVEITQKCEGFAKFVHIHECKEIENYLLVPNAIDRAVERLLMQARKRGVLSGKDFAPFANAQLLEFARSKKSEILGEFTGCYYDFCRSISRKGDSKTFNHEAINEFELIWSNEATRNFLLPGKKVISALSTFTRDNFGVNLTISSIIEVMRKDDITAELHSLLAKIETLSGR